MPKLHHIRQIADEDLPRIQADDGVRRPATEQELMNHNLFRVGTAENGDGIYQVACVDPCPGHPGVDLGSGFLQERHNALAADMRERVLRARVYRAMDRRVNLRRESERDLTEVIRPGRRAPDRVRDKLRRQLEREMDDENDEPGRPRRTIERREISMAEIEDGDVVDEEEIYPMVMAGEPRER